MAADTHVNRVRRDVLEACRTQAKLPPGLFSLNVPTGGGKTLSSLAFALAHAVEHELCRVVYAIPFTSIIEQTADVFRRRWVISAPRCWSITATWSPMIPHGNPNARDWRRELRRSPHRHDERPNVRVAVRRRTSRCRKLHRLAKSVIILDEAQTLPPSCSRRHSPRSRNW